MIKNWLFCRFVNVQCTLICTWLLDVYMHLWGSRVLCGKTILIRNSRIWNGNSSISVDWNNIIILIGILEFSIQIFKILIGMDIMTNIFWLRYHLVQYIFVQNNFSKIRGWTSNTLAETPWVQRLRFRLTRILKFSVGIWKILIGIDKFSTGIVKFIYRNELEDNTSCDFVSHC